MKLQSFKLQPQNGTDSADDYSNIKKNMLLIICILATFNGSITASPIIVAID